MPPLVTTKENDAALSLQDSQASLEQLDAATSLNGLAAVYYIEGQFENAELLLNRALAIHEKALGGAEHPDLARNFNNLALIYNAKRRVPL